MNPKTTIGLVIALIIAVAGVWWAQSSSQQDLKKESAGPRPLFDPDLGELTAFEMTSGGPAMQFVMVDSKWRMQLPTPGPVEHLAVNTDINKLKDLKYVSSYAPGAADRPTPELTSLSKPLLVAKLTDQSGKPHVVKIGATQALSSRTYVQKEGDETLYLVDADLSQIIRKRPADYRSKRPAEFNANDAVRVEITGERNYTLVKSDKLWTLESPVRGRADANKVMSLIRGVSNLSAVDFVEDAARTLRPFGLEPPRLALTITTETKTPKPTTQPAGSQPAEPEFDVKQAVIRLALGASAEEKTFAMIPDAGAASVFRIAESSAKTLAPDLAELRDTRVTTLDTARASRIVVRTLESTADLSKIDGIWRIVPAAADASFTSAPTTAPMAEFAAIDDLLKAIRELKALGFEAQPQSAFGLDSPRAAIEITAEGQLEPVRLAIGGLTPSKTGAYVRNIGEDFIAVVASESADTLAADPIAFLSRDLLRFTAADAIRLDITRGAAQYTLVQEEGAWKLTAPVAAEPEHKAVLAVIGNLSNLRGRRVVGESADLPKFGLDDPFAVVKVTIANPAPASQPTTDSAADQPPAPLPPTVHTVLFSRHDGKSYATVFGGETICEVNAKVLTDLDAEFLSTQIAALDTAQASRIAYGPPASFAFEKSGNDWKLIGESTFQVNAEQITSLLTTINSLRALRYVAYADAKLPDFGLDAPAASIEIRSGEAAPLTLSVSRTGPVDGGRYAMISTQPGRVFVLKADEAQKLLRSAKDFQKPAAAS